MTKPNFFIIGAPKCGTTALSEYLRSHPQVFMSTPKEPSYFCFDLPGIQYIKDKEGYERLFSMATASQIAVGDASPGYLFSREAVAAIHDYNANARIIVMLRNPVEMLPSYHSQLVYSGYEDEKDFKKAWELQSARKNGKHLPKSCREPRALQYAEVPAFADQLERVYRQFPPDQILVLFFDDFKSNPGMVYERVLDFLELSPDYKNEFPVMNPNKSPRSDFLNRLLHKPPGWALELMRRHSGSSLHKYLVRVHGALKKINTEESKREMLDEQTRTRISTIFAEQIARVEVMTGRNLDAWK